MSTKITMGNDEFILYIRKNNKNCKISNDQLGKSIWVWIQDKDGNAVQKGEINCLWGENANHINALDLPKTATQFEFDRKILPELYDYLDTFK